MSQQHGYGLSMFQGLTDDPSKIQSLYAITSIPPVYKGFITREIFDALPEGAYIASHFASFSSSPAFYGRIPGASKRDVFWKALKRQGAPTGLFYVFNNRNSYIAYIEAFKSSMTR